MKIKGYFSFVNTIIVLCCTAYQLNAQEDPKFTSILEKLNTYNTTSTPEKVYLQTDRDHYANGDTLWFKTYILDGITHVASDKSRVVHVELVDAKQKVIDRRRIYTGFAGGSGDMVLTENMEEGAYFLRAYTTYMLNDREAVFFQKKIPIWSYNINSKKSSKKPPKKESIGKGMIDEIAQKTTQKTNIDFFPEGGNLVSGLHNILGLKITDSKGVGIALTGKLTDQNGALVSMFRTYELGLGRVQFEVEPETDYFIEIEVDGRLEKHQISKPMSKGYVLQVSNMGENIRLKISTNIVNGLNGAMVLGHVRGAMVLNYVAKNSTKNSYELKLSTANLNDGVGTFTLFTPGGEPVCERLVFIENPKNTVDLSIKTDTSNYGLRKKVDVDLTVLDELGLPIGGNFGMSVVAQNGLANEAENIKSWLLLNSDLGGTVEDPNYFFKNDSKGRENLLDLLMMTHGWRRFVWRELGPKEVETPLRFPPEKGILIKGKTVNANHRQEPVRGSVSLDITEPSAYKEETVTDTLGQFNFGPMIFRDSIKAVIQVSNALEGENEAAIYLEPPFPTIPIKDSGIGLGPHTHSARSNAFREEAYKKKVNDFEYDPKVIKLDEAVGKGKLKTKKELINAALNERTKYGQALNRVIPDSIPDSEFNSVIDLIERNVAGVRVFGQYPNQRIELRPHFGSNAIIDKSGLSSEHPKDPLYLLDGMPISSGFAKSMFGGEVLFIDVLKSAGEIAQYGVRGGNGVIALYTDRGENYEFVQQTEADATEFILPGFYRAREFYSPSYPLVKAVRYKPDFRTSLYWEPDINLSETEQTQLSFFTGDKVGRYTIRVEGMTNDGRPVHGIHTFTIGAN